MNRKRFKCLDCDIDTGKIGEHYMLKDEIWLSVVGSKQGMLCVGCIETRLNHQLKPDDFIKCHINEFAPNKIFSNRLINRLYGTNQKRA